MNSSAEAMAEKLPENFNVTRETDICSIVFDEVHIKQEVNEELLVDLTPESTENNEFPDHVLYKLDRTSESLYCKICWTYCEDIEGLKDHLETSIECKQYPNSSLSVVEDRSGDSLQEEKFEVNVLQAFDGTTDVECCTDVIAGASQSRPTSNMMTFFMPFELNTSVKSTSAEQLYKTLTQNFNTSGPKLKYTGERQFICDMCNQTFTRNCHLKRHKLIHTGERHFACDVCDQTFTQKYNLNRHKLIHTGERPFACDLCIQKFTKKDNLNAHKLKHTGERPFICDVCNYSFIRKSHLNRHKLKHTGERPYICDVCNRTFTQKSHLNRHKLKHK